MNIRMYDCMFGDCFRVEPETDKYNPLYVDFGIHHRSAPKISREDRYKKIIEDMPDHKDFLLTHYHEDHYDGVIYMYQNFPCQRFDNVYIPDIWNISGSVYFVSLILLKGLLGNYYLNNNITLFSFLASICRNSGRIHFISKGDIVQKVYTVLWPEMDNIKVPNDLDIPDELREIASDIVRVMQRIGENGEVGEEYATVFDGLNDRFRQLSQPDDPNNSNIRKLSDWENNISIVFHSTSRLKRNVIFTGDVPKCRWRRIDQNRNSDRCAKSGGYDVIKIPHHGTTPYYHDFDPYSHSSTSYMIPNGNYLGWQIDHQYSSLSTSSRKVYCSNNNACKAVLANKGICKCPNCTIINNSGTFYVDV